MDPREHTSFVGRRDLLAVVRARLGSAQLVTLTGPGGVGKTRVAERVRDDLRRLYPDGRWSVALADVGDQALVASAIAHALGLHVAESPVTADALADHLGEREALLVLDSCEHLLDGCAEVVAVLRSRCPRLRVLATSRQLLGLSGEEVVPVPPLTVPERGQPSSPESLAHYEAVTLFVDRATSAQADFALTGANAVAVARLCRALEGIPLAIELAAARIRTLTPDAMLKQLTDRFALLSRGYRDMTARHRTLRSCVQWSFDLCDEAERALWTRCAVFVGGFELPAAQFVCTGEDLPGAGLLDVVESLVDQSVLFAEPVGAGEVRYRMLDYIREYGLERLDEGGELDRWRGRHLTWCTDLASGFRSDWVGPRQATWLRRLGLEHANIRAALELCTQSPSRAATGLAIAVDLDSYWVTSGRISEALHWLDVGLDAGPADAADPADTALALVFAARFAGLQHDLPRARSLLALAAAKADATGDDLARGLALIPAAILAVWQREHEAAVSAARRSVELLARAGDPSAELLAWSIAGDCLRLAGDPDGATEAYERTLALADQYGELFRRSLALVGLGELRLGAGDAAAAAGLFREALRAKADLEDQMGCAVALDGLGRVAVVDGRGERAALLLGAAEAIWDVIGMVETGNPFAGTAARSDGIEQARELLGKQSFRATFRRGSELSTVEAVAFGLGDEATLEVPAARRTRPPGPSPLTRREAEVADLVADGLSNPEIAARLVISVRTAQGHVENILRKLGFTSRAMIAAWVAQRRLAT